jgi:tetratricopeptide (TPR) repeat protein
MRKVFVFILAIILGLAVVTAGLMWKKEKGFKKITTDSIIELWSDILPIKKRGTPKIPNSQEVDIVKVEPEPDLTYDERIEKGDYYFDRGFLTFASNEYVKAANLQPEKVEPYLKLLNVNYEFGDYKKAQKNAEIVLQMDPNQYETRIKLALTYIKQSNFIRANDILKGIAETAQAPDARISYYLGLLKIIEDLHEEGKNLLKQAKVDNHNPELAEKIDIFLDAYTEYEFAKASEELYLAELLARGLNKAGEYEMAIYKLKNILQTRNDLRDSWILFGFAYLNLEKYYFALSAFERAYELDSQWPTTQYFIGVTHTELQNTDDAIIYFNYALSNNFEPSLVIYRKLADLYTENKEYTKAVEYYEKVLEENDEDINSFIRPIWIYLDHLKDPVKAVRLAELSVMAFPEDAMSYNLMGWSQVATGNYTEAEKSLKKAIELNPNLAAAHYNIGKLYETDNKRSLALEAYQKAYELDQNGSIGNKAAKDYNKLMTNK